MRAKVSRSDFFNVISHSIGVVDKKPAVPVLSHVLLVFEDGRITVKATDLDHSLTATVEAQVETFGSVAVHGQMLFDILRKLGGSSVLELAIADQGRKMIISSGKSRFEVQTIAADEFPVIDSFVPESSFILSSKALRDLIDLTKFAMAVEETRYNLNGIYFHATEDKSKLKAAATDGHRLAVSAMELNGGTGMAPGIYSRKTILEVRKLLDDDEQEVSVSTSKNTVQFQVGNVVLTARLVDGTFPNYAAVIPAVGPKSFVVDRKAFIECIDRVSVISDDKSRTIKLEMRESSLCLSSTNMTAGGSGKDEIIVEKTSDEPWDACFNARYLIDVADALSCEKLTVYYSGKLSSILILPDDGSDNQFVVMPMRI